MIKTSIEKLAQEIGYDIGASDDETQSNLLNGFCKSISNSMDNNKLQTQLCYVADKLTPQSEKVLIELVEFIKIKKENV
jgi:hypothetical protein